MKCGYCKKNECIVNLDGTPFIWNGKAVCTKCISRKWRTKSKNQYDEFLHKVQQAKMKELWGNKEDEGGSMFTKVKTRRNQRTSVVHGKRLDVRKKCKICLGYGMRPIENDPGPIIRMVAANRLEASKGIQTLPCPECGASVNPHEGGKAMTPTGGKTEKRKAAPPDVIIVEDFVKEHSGEFSKRSLWKELSNKITYRRCCAILNYLAGSNKIATDREGKIAWIWNPEGVRKIIAKGVVLR